MPFKVPSDFQLDEEQLIVDMRNFGQTGLNRAAGIINEEILPQLDGQRGMRIFRDMGESDALCAGYLSLLDKLTRSVTWRVEPASSQPYDKEAADFLDTCRNDMRHPWSECVSEWMTMVQYGFCVSEVVLKRRLGDDPDPVRNSRYRDGRIGWRDMPIRSQDSIVRWHFDRTGEVIGFEQQSPPDYNFVSIPIDKCFHVRTRSFKNNPLGLSAFRGAYESWYMKRAIARIEAIGIERDLAGLPVAGVPVELLSQNASTSSKALLGHITNILRNVRNNEQACIVYPQAYDEQGKEMFTFKLMNSGGARSYDTSKIIERYDHRIAATFQFDFALLGSSGGASGSWAMHDDKTKMFLQGASAMLDIISEQLNRTVVPRLMNLNSFRMSDYPKIVHSGLEKTDLKEIGEYVKSLAAAGVQLFPNIELEEALLEVANLPKPLSYEALSQQADVQPNPVAQPEKVQEVHDTQDKSEADPSSRPFASRGAQQAFPFSAK